MPNLSFLLTHPLKIKDTKVTAIHCYIKNKKRGEKKKPQYQQEYRRKHIMKPQNQLVEPKVFPTYCVVAKLLLRVIYLESAVTSLGFK